jgi:hypothetical protein
VLHTGLVARLPCWRWPGSLGSTPRGAAAVPGRLECTTPRPETSSAKSLATPMIADCCNEIFILVSASKL